MILTCPTCSARFIVNSAAIGTEGREVRCGRCNHSWFATGSDDAAAATPAPEPPIAEPGPAAPSAALDDDTKAEMAAPLVQEPVLEAEEPLRPRRQDGRRGSPNVPAISKQPRHWPARLVWIALILVVIGLGALSSLYRADVIAVWPETEQLYAAIGMEQRPLGFGLSLIIDSSEQAEKDGEAILVISGRIENQTQSKRTVPGLLGALFDAQERELQRWTFPAPVTTLPPNQNASFKTELADPAKNAVRLSIIFHESEGESK